MPDAAAWQAFGGIVVVLIFLGSGVVALKRLGLLGSKPAATAPANGNAATPASDDNAKEIAALREELHELRLCMERNFVRRDDWVPHTSRVQGALEAQSRSLARLEGWLAQRGSYGSDGGA